MALLAAQTAFSAALAASGGLAAVRGGLGGGLGGLGGLSGLVGGLLAAFLVALAAFDGLGCRPRRDLGGLGDLLVACQPWLYTIVQGGSWSCGGRTGEQAGKAALADGR